MAYCNQEDIEFVLSEAGVTYTSADVGDETDTANVALSIEKAESQVKQALRKVYDISTISDSNTWVKWCTATYAAVILTRRRGNSVPDSLWVEREEYRKILDAVQAGTAEIPDLNPRYEPGLTMGNLRIDSHKRTGKVRVVSSISVGQRDSKKIRKIDHYDYSGDY